jgi:hypothetical protein
LFLSEGPASSVLGVHHAWWWQSANRQAAVILRYADPLDLITF